VFINCSAYIADSLLIYSHLPSANDSHCYWEEP